MENKCATNRRMRKHKKAIHSRNYSQIASFSNLRTRVGLSQATYNAKEMARQYNRVILNKKVKQYENVPAKCIRERGKGEGKVDAIC